MKYSIAIFSISSGVLVIAYWLIFFLIRVPEGGLIEMSFHLYAEFATSVILLVSGIMLLGNRKHSVETNMGGLGMLVYSTLTSAGLHGQNGDTIMMIIFLVLFVLAVSAICGHYYSHNFLHDQANDPIE